MVGAGGGRPDADAGSRVEAPCVVHHGEKHEVGQPVVPNKAVLWVWGGGVQCVVR